MYTHEPPVRCWWGKRSRRYAVCTVARAGVRRSEPAGGTQLLTDHAADLLLAPTWLAMDNLAAEGLAERSGLVGDVMTDGAVRRTGRGRRAASPAAGRRRRRRAVSGLHDPAENTDDADRLAAIVTALAGLPMPVVLLAHPRLAARARDFGIELARGAVHRAQPLPYPEMVATVLRSRGVVTDSGGLQKEAFLLGVPCTTLRTETEWPETLEGGWNVLAPDLVGLAEIVNRPRPEPLDAAPYGDGAAARAVVAALERHAR